MRGVEQDCVLAVPASQCIAAISSDERVVAGATGDCVGTRAAGDRVVARAANELEGFGLFVQHPGHGVRGLADVITSTPAILISPSLFEFRLLILVVFEIRLIVSSPPPRSIEPTRR